MRHALLCKASFLLYLLPALVCGLIVADRPKYAILVDAENAQYASIPSIVEEIVALGGESIVRRIYGDFSSSHLWAWRKVAMNCSFVPVNAFSFIPGKGTSDSALIIDAMELLYTQPYLSGFALVSSDSDFTRLAQKLREAGKHVIGFGNQCTPLPFVMACERFIHTENLDIDRTRIPPYIPSRSTTTYPKRLHKQLKKPQDSILSTTTTSTITEWPSWNSTKPSIWTSSSSSSSPAQSPITTHKVDHKRSSSSSSSSNIYPARNTPFNSIESYPKKALMVPSNGIQRSTWGESKKSTIPSRYKKVPSEQDLALIRKAIHDVSDDHGWALLGNVGPSLTALRSDFDFRDYGYKSLNSFFSDLGGDFELMVTNGFTYSVRCKTPTRNLPTEPKLSPQDLQLIQKAIVQASDEQGWALLSRVGERLIALKSDFDVRDYGYTKLMDCLTACKSLFEVKVADDSLTYSIRNKMTPVEASVNSTRRSTLSKLREKVSKRAHKVKRSVRRWIRQLLDFANVLNLFAG